MNARSFPGFPPAPLGYVACRTMIPGATVTHLVKLDENGSNGGRPTVCGLTRFDDRDADGAPIPGTAGLPGWGLGDSGVQGPSVDQFCCQPCYVAVDLRPLLQRVLNFQISELAPPSWPPIVVNELEPLAAALQAIRTLHAPTEEDCLEWDCFSEECDHNGTCPAVQTTTCRECRRIAEEIDPEAPITLYPCPTITALDNALNPTQADAASAAETEQGGSK